ncbi:MAG: glycosyltransferase [Gemmatimonadota bacterium]
MSLGWVVVHDAVEWSGRARAALALATAVAERAPVRVAAPAGSAILARAAAAGVKVVSWPPAATDRAVAAVLAPLAPGAWLATSAPTLGWAAAAARRAGRGALVRRIAVGERPATPGRRWFGRPPAAAWIFASRPDAEKVVLPPGSVRGGVLEPWAAPAPRRAPAVPAHVALVVDRTPDDRAHEAMRGAAALLRAHRDVRLVLLGEGASDDAMRVHAGALGIADRVLTGYAFDDARWIAAAVAAWVAADGDDGAYAALTAAAHGVPVLATRGTTAARGIVPGTSGEAVPVGDPHLAAGVLAHWLGDDARRRAMGNAGRERLALLGEPSAGDVLQRAVEALRGPRSGAA